MDTLLQMRTAVYQDLTANSTSTLFDTTVVDSAINRAYRKAGSLYRWPELEDAKKTSTQANIDYYDYPETWQPDSLWRITIDGVTYGEEPDGSPLSFKDYLLFKENYPSSTDKKWSSQWRRYFISPTPTVTGSNNIVVWGQKTVETLSNTTDITIFSYAMPECNEAIVLEAGAILRAKGEDENRSQFRSNEAKQILTLAWNKIKQNQAKYKKIQPFLNVPDFYGRGNSKSLIGDFDI